MISAEQQSSPAQRQLVDQHVSLADKIAGRLYRTYGWVGLEELKSYAYMGLMLAARSYSPDRGVPFESFAMQKAMFLAIDEMRKDGVVSRRRAKVPKIVAEDQVPEMLDPAGERFNHAVETRDYCRTLLKSLDGNDRRLLLLYYTEEMTFREIAETFDISESAVCLRHKAIMRRLRQLADRTTMS